MPVNDKILVLIDCEKEPKLDKLSVLSFKKPIFAQNLNTNEYFRTIQSP